MARVSKGSKGSGEGSAHRTRPGPGAAEGSGVQVGPWRARGEAGVGGGRWACP